MRLDIGAFLIAAWISLPTFAADSGKEIPFDFLHNQIVLRGVLNGHGPYSFILDTGTRATTIDLQVARELGLPLGAQATSEGVGAGRSMGRHTTFVDLQIGGIAVRRLDAAVFDLSGVSRSLGRPLHGVLGFGFLDSRVTQIDYFQRRIRFYEDSPFPMNVRRDDEKSISFPMQFHAQSVLPVLEDCYVNGMPLTVTLDTGSSLGLVLFPRTIERLGLGELARTGIPMEAAGYLGEARLTKGWVKSVVLKSIDLGAIEVAYSGKGYATDENPERRGGSIGNAILQDFVLTLDYRARVVTLQSVAE
jgi:predicted aspartyl protease